MSKIMFNGVPTDAEVNRLREAFPINELKTGTLFPHETIESIVGESRDSGRYRTIVMRWKNLIEKETLHYLGSVRGEGFKLFNDNEKADASGKFADQSRRKLFKGMKILPKIDRKNLTDENKVRVNRLESNLGQARAMLQVKAAPVVKEM